MNKEHFYNMLMCLNKLKECGAITYHHNALVNKYISRKTEGRIYFYNGKYGKGIAWEKPNWKSSRYSIIEYYIYK